MHRNDVSGMSGGDVARIARMLKALGDPTRLRIFQFLQMCCDTVALAPDGTARPHSGAVVGDVCCSILGDRRITSTLSFHLHRLWEAGLITMERRGRYRVCAVNEEAVLELRRFLEFGEMPSRATCEEEA